MGKSRLDGTKSVDDTCRSDFLALSIIVTSAVKSKMAIKVSNVLSTIAEDAMVYFFVIFGSHLGVLMTLLLGRVSTVVSNSLHR